MSRAFSTGYATERTRRAREMREDPLCDFGGATPNRLKARAEAQLVAERRAKAGNPTYQPRNDFVGGPALKGGR